MGEWGWIVLGWLTVSGVIAVYSMTVLVRGRRLSRDVPEERRRWTS